jgi:probable rRNA maturation factor
MKVFLADEQDDPLEPEPLIALAESVLRAEQLPDDTEVWITLVGRDEMATLNDRFLQREGPTDVLALPIEDLQPGAAPEAIPDGPPLNLGDVIICPQIVASNAAIAEVSFGDELALMVVHGILHLLGYDHHEDEEAERMEARERTLLAAMGRARP